MAECSEYQKSIAGSFLGILNEQEQKDLDQHLAECPLCRAEKTQYEKAVNMLKKADDEPVPRHFFVHLTEAEKESNLWRLFRSMKPRWQAATVSFFIVFLLLTAASASRLQVQASRGNFRVSFGERIDVEALKQEILKETEARNSRLGAEFAGVVASLDARLSGRMTLAENRVRLDAQKSLVDMYRLVSQQRAQDLGIINYRFEDVQTDSAIKTQQTNEILSTLLQEAELRLKRMGEEK
jgi:hypothetical protein